MCKPCGNHVEGVIAKIDLAILRFSRKDFLVLRSPVFMRFASLLRESVRRICNRKLRFGARFVIKEESARGIIVACGCGKSFESCKRSRHLRRKAS
jgi:hypothetical protein